MQFTVSLLGEVRVVTSDGTTPENVNELLELHLDTVMDELEKLGAEDPAIELDLETAQVKFEVLVDALNPIVAVEQASGTIRCAIHAAHGSTPDWPTPGDDAWSVRLVSVSSQPVLVAA